MRPGLRLLSLEKRFVIAYIFRNEVISVGRIFYGGRDVEALIGKME